MKPKLDGTGNIVLENGMPVYLNHDGNEIVVDVAKLFSKISDLNNESMKHRLAYNEAKTQIEDLKKSRQNDTELTSLKEKVRSLMIDNGLMESSSIKNTVLPVSVAKKYFGDAFKIVEKDGEFHLVAHGKDGNPIYSKENTERYASFDEAISILIDSDPTKDTLLKAPANGMGVSSTKFSGAASGNYDLSNMSVKDKIALKDQIGREKYQELIENQSK